MIYIIEFNPRIDMKWRTREHTMCVIQYHIYLYTLFAMGRAMGQASIGWRSKEMKIVNDQRAYYFGSLLNFRNCFQSAMTIESQGIFL